MAVIRNVAAFFVEERGFLIGEPFEIIPYMMDVK